MNPSSALVLPSGSRPSKHENGTIHLKKTLKMPSMLSSILSYNKKDSVAKFPGFKSHLATYLLGDMQQVLKLLRASVSLSAKGGIIIVPISRSCFEDYMN